MRAWTILMLPLALAACGRGGPLDDKTATDTDADTDADTDSDTDADTDSDTDADTDTDIDVTACLEGPNPTGPWDTHPISEAGAAATNLPYAFDAGVDAVRTAATNAGDGTDTDTFPDDVTVDLRVEGAIVLLRGYVPNNPVEGTVNFWFADQSGAMYAFGVDVRTAGGIEPNEIAPGDEVSFTATAVTNFAGTPEVVAISNFTVDSSGNDVWVKDGTAGLTSDDVSSVVEIWGGLASSGEGCGGSSLCYDYETPGGTYIFRSSSTYVQPRDCIHFIGPVSQFGGAVQLDTIDYDWYFQF